MTSPFITTQDAARYLLFTDTGRDDGTPDLVRLHHFLRRYRGAIRTVKRGGTVLIDKQSLDAHLNRFSSVSRRHGASVAPSSSSVPVNGVERGL